MPVFRSYFLKNNSIITDNRTNNSQNPVTEISYGTLYGIISRYIFDLNLEQLQTRIQQGSINIDNIISHKLHLTNTIINRDDLLGGRFNFNETERASSFDLELFNISEEWDEGSGYDFVYNDEAYPLIPEGVVNWYDKETNIPWLTEGIYNSGTTEIIGTQHFQKGNENIEIDITDYVNSRLITGSTGFTGTTYGLGLKFINSLEETLTTYRQAVAFYGKHTHTFFEPYIETTYNDIITDDRHYFFLEKDNNLYLYVNIGNNIDDVQVSGVTIYDNNNNVIAELSGTDIEKVKLGIYKIALNIGNDFPDAVIFKDVWKIILNGKEKTISQKFYLISEDNYYDFDLSNQINFDNYYFTFTGIKTNEKIKRGDIRKINVNVKELYPDQNKNVPLDLEYRIFTTQGGKNQIDVISYTSVNRTTRGYELNIDTSWLIPQDYFIELKLNSNNQYRVLEPTMFSIISEI